MLISGRVWAYGDNINTDVIFPGKYTYTVTARDEIARHALEDLDPAFVDNVQPGDVIARITIEQVIDQVRPDEPRAPGHERTRGVARVRFGRRRRHD